MNGAATRLCVTNAKGGTGKTTIAINVAGALAHLGNEVLVVDLDPQGNATEGLGAIEAYDDQPPSLYDLLVNPGRHDPAELIVDAGEVDLIPSNVDMLQAERVLTAADLFGSAAESTGASAAELASIVPDLSADGLADPVGVLDDALGEVEAEYDYVVIDAPPFYGRLTDVAMYAAPNVIVPTLTESTSERAIELLFDRIADLEARTGAAIEEVGVVANRVEATNEDEEMLEWLDAVFPDVPIWEVRKRVALQRTFSAGTSIFEYDDSLDVADVFLEVGERLDERFQRQEANA